MEFQEGLLGRQEQVGIKKIVKKSGAVQGGLDAVKFESFGASGEARAEIARLKGELAELQREMKKQQAQAKKDLEALDQRRLAEVEEKRQAALKMGEEAGRKAAEAIYNQKEEGVLKAFLEVIQGFEQERKHFFEVTEEGVAAVVSAMSRRIIGEYIDLNPHIVEKSVREALGYLGNEKELILLLNPEDFAWVQAHYKEWVPLTQTEINIRLKEDPRIAKGGCLLETEAGRIDVRIERMLDNLSNFIHQQFVLAQNK